MSPLILNNGMTNNLVLLKYHKRPVLFLLFMHVWNVYNDWYPKANKIMHLSEVAYNMKHYLKFINKKVKSDLGELNYLIICKIDQIASRISVFKHHIILKTDVFFNFLVALKTAYIRLKIVKVCFFATCSKVTGVVKCFFKPI